MTFVSPINFKTGQPVNTKTTEILAHCGTGRKEESQKEEDAVQFLLMHERKTKRCMKPWQGSVFYYFHYSSKET